MSATATSTPRRPADRRRSARPSDSVVIALALEAATVGVFAILHLSGALRIGAPGRSSGAGIAEAVISVVLSGGAVALARSSGARGRRVAFAAVGFATFGFLIGLSFTLGSGDAIDLGYHLAMLPVLVATAVVLAARRPAARRPAARRPATDRPRAV